MTVGKNDNPLNLLTYCLEKSYLNIFLKFSSFLTMSAMSQQMPYSLPLAHI